MAELKRVCAINDISGFGRCSLTVAIPVISSFGFQVCPFPTAMLSAHTGFKSFSFADLTPFMEEYALKWQELGVKFNCIYSGFLGSLGQIDIVSRFAKNNKNALFLVDPVMGDEGLIYKTYTDKMCEAMRTLCKSANIITPNLTEACILTNTPYPQGELTEKEIEALLLKLSRICKGNIVITGIPKKGKFINGVLCENKISLFENAHINLKINGGGDLFASLLCAYILKEETFENAVKKAGDFTMRAIEYTKETLANPENGIVFEPLLVGEK